MSAIDWDQAKSKGGDEAHETIEVPVVLRVADVATEPVRWLWSGRLPRGKVVMLDGDPALGKSTLMLDLAARLTTGSPMPDGESADGPETVLIMTAEDGIADTVRPRLEAAGADLERVEVFTEITMIDGATRLPSIPMDLGHVETLVTRSGAALVIIDVLNAYLSSKIDGYRDQDVRGALHPLAKMAERTGATVVCLRHLSKTGGANAIYRGGGSIGIIGGARAGLLVAPDPEDDSRRVLAVSKSNLAAKPASLAYRLVSDQLRAVARVRWEGKVDYTADGLLVTREEERTSDDEIDAVDVLTDILADGPVWVAEAIKAMAGAGLSKDQAKRAKAKAGVRSVKVGKPGDAEQGWQWVLPTRREHEGSEGSEGSAIQNPAPFAPFGGTALPSEEGLPRPEDGSDPPEGGEGGTSQNPATFATSLPSSGKVRGAEPAALSPAPDLVDLPLDQVGACRVCRVTTVRTDGEGAICARCHEQRWAS